MSIPIHLLRKQQGGKKEKKAKSTNLMDRIEECDRAGQFELDLSHLKLNDWPQETIILSAIHHCKGYGNLFTSIPSFAAFRGLETIDLSRCNIETINEMEVSQLFNLKVLNLSRNNLKELPAEIARLVSLETLLVDRNQLQTFPGNMGNMRTLRLLDASNNQLIEVGTLLDRIPALEDLNLSNNPHLDVEKLGTRTRRLHEKRMLLSSKKSRRAMIERALNIQRNTLSREQEAIFRAVYEGPAKNEVDELP